MKNFTISYIGAITLLLFFSCFLDPNYNSDPTENTNNVELRLLNTKTADFFKVTISAKDMNKDIIFYDYAPHDQIFCQVPKGKDRSFRVDGYEHKNNQEEWHYTKEFKTDISGKDTTIKVELEYFEVPKPNPPNWKKIELVNNNLVKLTWEAVSDADEYILYRKLKNENNFTLLTRLKDFAYEDASVVPEKVYEYGISANNKGGESSINTYDEQISIPAPQELPEIPDNVKISNTTDVSVTIIWDQAAFATEYNIYRAQGSGVVPNQLVATVDKFNYEDKNLKPVMDYTYAVSSVNKIGESSKSSRVEAQTLAPIPETPEGLQAKALSYESITVSWEKVDYAEVYEVHRSLQPDDCYFLEKTTGQISYTSDSLKEETTYYYKILARNKSGISPFTKPANAKTLAISNEKPETPENVKAKPLSESEIKLEWSVAKYASSYIVYRSLSASGTFDKIDECTDTIFTDSKLDENTTYYYKVSGLNKNGESSQSDLVESTTFIHMTVPTGITLEALSATKIRVTWNAVTGAKKYRLVRALTETGIYEDIGKSATTTYTDTGLDPNTTYYYKISAKGDAGESDQSQPKFATTKLPAPDTPQNLRALALTATSIKIEFDAAVNANGYNIYWSKTATGTFDKLTSIGSTTYDHNNLSPSTTYYYKVSAYNDEGESALSDPSVSATTNDPPPNIPTGLKAKGISKTEIQVDFNKVSDADGYVLYSSTSSSGVFDTLDTLTTNTYTHQNLSADKEYYYKVSAFNTNGESNQSKAVSAKVLIKKVAFITRCRSCGKCPRYCDVDAIKYKNGKYWVDPEICTGCGDCIPSCPYGYIELIDPLITKIKSVLGSLFKR